MYFISINIHVRTFQWLQSKQKFNFSDIGKTRFHLSIILIGKRKTKILGQYFFDVDDRFRSCSAAADNHTEDEERARCHGHDAHAHPPNIPEIL